MTCPHLVLLLLRLLMELMAAEAFMRYSFKFPHTSYELGQRHIHSPEHLATSHLLTLPCFRLVETVPPTRFGNHTMVSFDYATLLGTGRAYMFTARPQECNVYLTDTREQPFFLARLAVSPDPDSPRGHVLRAHGEFLREPTWLQRTLAPAFIQAHAAEIRAHWGFLVPAQDPNLRAYRSSVFCDGLDSA